MSGALDTMIKLLFVVGLFIGLASMVGRSVYHESLDACRVEMEDLKEGYKILEENLLYCWSELPVSHIREGSIDN